jgi:hypothetical protein
MKTKIEIFFCDCCGKQLKKTQAQRHHLIPKLLRNCSQDNQRQVILCNSCHVLFHKLVNFADPYNYSKEYFAREYYRFKMAYKKEQSAFKAYREAKEGGDKNG